MKGEVGCDLKSARKEGRKEEDEGRSTPPPEQSQVTLVLPTL